jgi:4-carboxymuconolactone decarboxylase
MAGQNVGGGCGDARTNGPKGWRPAGGGARVTPEDDGKLELRARGLAKMEEVYNFSVDPAQLPGDFAALTVDHLFGTIWTRPGLEVAERRLLTIGVLAALGQRPLLEIQFRSALDRHELDDDQVREIVVHLTHYIGWPLATIVNEAAERVLGSRTGEEK